MKSENQASYVVETITMTTVTEHRIIRTAEDANTEVPPPKPPKAVTLQPPALPEGRSIYASSQSVENMKNDLNATVFPKFNVNGTAQAITGILKGGKFRKTDSVQVSDFLPLTQPEIKRISISCLIRLTKQTTLRRMKRRVPSGRFASMKMRVATRGSTVKVKLRQQPQMMKARRKRRV